MTDNEIKELIGPFNGETEMPYYRPFTEYQNGVSYKVFLVGINPATAIYPKQVNDDEFVEMLRDSNIFKEKYHTIRKMNNKTGISRTRMGIENLTREIETKGIKILQTNIISLPTPSAKDPLLKRKEILEDSLNNFFVLLNKERPSTLILYSKKTLEYFRGLLVSKGLLDEKIRFNESLKVMEEREGPLFTFKNTDGSEISVFVCRHLRYYGKEGGSYNKFKNNVFKHLGES